MSTILPALFAVFSALAPTALGYPLLATTPRFSCEELILGAQRGASYDGLMLQTIKRVLEWRLSVRITGLDEVLAVRDGRGRLVLANHSSPVDPALLVTQLGPALAMRPVMTGNLRGFPLTDRLLGAVGGFIQPEPSTGGLTGARLITAQFDEVGNATRHGDTVFFYPSGYAQTSPYEHLAGQSMLYEVLQRDPHARVILVRVRGLWGSETGHGARTARLDHLMGTDERIRYAVRRAALVLATNGPFAPKRPVTIEVVEPTDVPRFGTRAEINAYLTQFYDAGPPERRTFVKTHVLMPGPTLTYGDDAFTYGAADQRWARPVPGRDEVEPAFVAEVVTLLRMLPRLGEIAEGTDLGEILDSLAKVDVFLSVLDAYGVRLADDAHFRDARDLARLITAARVDPGASWARALDESRPWFSDEAPVARDAKRLRRWAADSKTKVVGVLGPREDTHALARVLDGAGVRAFGVDWAASADEVTAHLAREGASIILTTAPLLREIARSHDLSGYLDRVRLVTDPGGRPPLP